jgi:hypothetical protein
MHSTGAPPSVIVTDVEGDIVAADSLDSDYDYEDNDKSCRDNRLFCRRRSNNSNNAQHDKDQVTQLHPAPEFKNVSEE